MCVHRFLILDGAEESHRDATCTVAGIPAGPVRRRHHRHAGPHSSVDAWPVYWTLDAAPQTRSSGHAPRRMQLACHLGSSRFARLPVSLLSPVRMRPLCTCCRGRIRGPTEWRLRSNRRPPNYRMNPTSAAGVVGCAGLGSRWVAVVDKLYAAPRVMRSVGLRSRRPRANNPGCT